MKVLSARLTAILDLLGPCGVLADVGTDHGLLPIAAVSRGIASHVIAADLREAPLVLARKNIERAGVQDRVTVVQADGLLPLKHHPIDAVVMAGMSAGLMVRLACTEPQALAGVEQLVVQPNRDVSLMREWALSHGWHLRDERMVAERGRFFVVCAFMPGSGEDPAYAVPGFTQPALCKVGPLLLARRDPIALRSYQEQRAWSQHWVETGVSTLRPQLSAWQRVCDSFD